jgi:transcriptional regulator with XRE-family HTH domain
MHIDAERLRACRLAAKLSLRDLANICKVSKSAISFYEAGQLSPKIEYVRAIAAALNVSVEYLTGESDIKTPAPEELSEGERAWIELYRRLSPDVRETFVTMVKTFDSLPEGERQMLLAMIRGALGSQAK